MLSLFFRNSPVQYWLSQSLLRGLQICQPSFFGERCRSRPAGAAYARTISLPAMSPSCLDSSVAASLTRSASGLNQASSK